MKTTKRLKAVDRVKTNFAKHVKLRAYYKWRVKSRVHFGLYKGLFIQVPSTNGRNDIDSNR